MHRIDYSNGVENFYLSKGKSYRNPHEERVQKVVMVLHKTCNLGNYIGSSVLDVACGSGEASLALQKISPSANYSFIDPYTSHSLKSRIPTADCMSFTFMDIANGALEGRSYDLCIISYAFHLVPKNILALFTMQLSCICKFMLLIHPHKKDKCNQGFTLIREAKFDQTVAYLYSSNSFY
eukprot:NODE_117_length_18986_cov_0.639540.p9 type:complete len:180 gc:universal NODE_117_length_18986_cov_0.639540:10135-9596(-)